MPGHFTLRMQCDPKQDHDQGVRQLLELVRAACVDEVLLFIATDELSDGHDTLAGLTGWIESTRPYHHALKQAGVQVSLNAWHSLYHDDLGRTLKPGQDWQRMVDPNGRMSDVVVCPLDPGWRQYFEQTLRLYAREGFRVIWIDDDFRFHNHKPLAWGGCFCPLHVERFNERAGVEARRDQIVANCTAPGEPHPWRDTWLDMWDESQVELLAHWRRIVEEGGSRLGFMSSLPELHAAEGRRWPDWWKALSESDTPIHRPNYWAYGDALGSELPTFIARLDQYRSVHPPLVHSEPELESFPYSRWNKSMRQTGAQMALAHVMGSTGVSLNLYDPMGNRPDDDPQRAEFLHRWRPICDWLADEFPMSLRTVGVGIPWSPDMGRRIRTDHRGDWQALECPSRGWAAWLGAAGHAFAMRPSNAVNALAGPIVWSFRDEQLIDWLSHGMLLDGPAAAILVERGLGALIGVTEARFVSQWDVLYTFEQMIDERFAIRPGARVTVNRGPHCRRLLQCDLLDGTHVASDVRSPHQEVVGHGLVLFANELGGRIAIVPWAADEYVTMDVHRQAQLTGILEHLDPTYTHGSVSGGPWLVPQFLCDDERWRSVIWNASPDEIEQFTVDRPAEMPAPTQAIAIHTSGDKEDAAIDGNLIRLRSPLGQWEFVILL